MAKPLRQPSRKLIKRHPGQLQEFLDPEYLSCRRAKFWASCLLLLLSGTTFIVVFSFVQELIKERRSASSLIASANIALPYQPPDMTQILMWGHRGQGVTINVSKLFEGHREEYQSGLQTFGLNKYLSDRISMRRSLPDVRSDQCLNNTPYSGLPNVSIIVVFRTEPRTTLLRMLYSVIDRSPPQHVREILLVDDNTEVKDLMYPRLEHYLAHLKQVSILRLTTNHGYARARMLAARRAKGRVLVFMQPRVECTEGWLTPLLQTLVSNLSTLAVPTVDDIDPLTFQYTTDDSTVRLGSFNWDLTPRKREIPLSALSGPTTLNPVLVDGVFAVRRDVFFRLGGLDQNLTRASSVDMELSFRSWMCGAGIELVRCSHVGLIISRYSKQPGLEQVEQAWEDNVRIAEMWLGDYKQFVYERIGVRYGQYQLQELSKSQHSMLDLEEECQSFSWFLQQVEPTMFLTLQIDSRGQIVSRSITDRVLAIGYRGGFVSLEDLSLTPGPFFWYLFRSGALLTENKMCLSYAQYSTASTSQAKDEQSFQHDSLQPLKSTLNLTSSYSVLNVSILGVGLSQDGPKKDSDPSTVESNKVKNEGKLPENKTEPTVNNNAQRELGLESDDIVVPSRSIQNRHEASLAQLRESGRSDTPTVGLGRQTGKPMVGLGGQTDTLMVRLGGQTDTPMVRLGGQTDTPMVRLGGQTDTPMIRFGEQAGNMTLLQSHDSQPETRLRLEPCPMEADGQPWFYSELETLQHVPSGLCLEVRKNAMGQFYLGLEKCVESSLAQKWTFVSGLS